MINKVHITRAAITKVTQMLAGQRVNVTQRGDQAFVQWDKRTHKVIRVNIPHLPDNASEELIAAVQGFLDHEVAHILFTDPKSRIGEKEPNAKRIDVMHNICEDCWIEPKMTKAYRGSAINLSRVRALVFQKRVGERVDQVIAKTGPLPEPDAVKHLLVVLMRALAGQEECREYMDAGDKWSFFPNILPRIEPYFKAELDRCATSWDTLELAKRVYADISDTSEPPESADPDKSDDESDSDECDDGAAGTEDPDKKDKPEDDAGEDDKDDGDGAAGEDEDDGDTEDDTESDSTGSGDEESDKDGDESEKGDGSEDDEAGDESDDSTHGDRSEGSDSADEDGDTESDDEGDNADGEESDGDDDKDTDRSEEVKQVLAAYDDVTTFEGEASAAILDMFDKDIREAGEWRVFSAEGDVIEPYKTSERFKPHMLTEMTDMVTRHVGPMQKEIERLLLTQKRSHYEPGRKSGRLNPSSLHRLKAGDPRVFRKKHETRIKDTAVSLVVDCSGSMGAGPGSRLAVAFEAAYALALTMERCKIQTQVSGFSTLTKSRELMAEQKDSESRLGLKYSVNREVHYQPIFKGWRDRMTSEISGNFADMRYDAKDITANNIDPLAVEWAGRDIMSRPEQRKVMIVLSDGQPAFDGDWNASRYRLKDVVAQAEKAGIEVVGIGIQSEAVREYYPKSVVIRNVNELAGALMGEMRRILLG